MKLTFDGSEKQMVRFFIFVLVIYYMSMKKYIGTRHSARQEEDMRHTYAVIALVYVEISEGKKKGGKTGILKL